MKQVSILLACQTLSASSFPLSTRKCYSDGVAGEDSAYLEYIRRQPCCAPGGECSGGVQAHHDRHQVGLALRAHDRRTIPLCAGHHRELHSMSGVFATWTGPQLREWVADRIAEHQARFQELPPECEIPW